MKKARTEKEFRQLCKETGLDLPRVAKPATGDPSRKHIASLLTWAKDRGFIIHPLGYGYYVDGFIEFRHCPCDKNRPTCPCDQAEEEINANGKCLCQLFWRDYGMYLTEKLGGLPSGTTAPEEGQHFIRLKLLAKGGQRGQELVDLLKASGWEATFMLES